MVALLALLGIGLIAGVVAGGSDDDIGPDIGADNPQANAGPGLFDEVGELVIAEEERVPLEDFLSESGVPAEDQQQILERFTFVSGPLDVETGDGLDEVLGSSFNDVIDTGGGNDFANGGIGDDVVQLGAGDDVYGNPIELGDPETGPSLLWGGDLDRLHAGDDEISGGSGNDLILDGYGSNVLNGNEDDDLLVSVDLDEVSPDSVNGGSGNDVLIVDQGDTVSTGSGTDEVIVELSAGVGAGYETVSIQDFNSEEDVIELSGLGDDEVAVADLDDGTGAVVSVGGVPVVVVTGGQGLTAGDIRIAEPAVG